ncbi:MAG: rhomboid family intramembrane serine protease [Micrococcaceae bacterium]
MFPHDPPTPRAPNSPQRSSEPGARDPATRSRLSRLIRSMVPVALPVALMWLVYVLGALLGTTFHEYGLRPRSTEGLIGVLAMPLLHLDLAHLISNSGTWLVLGTAIAWLTRRYLLITAGVWVLSGTLTWLLARDAVHIGASGVTYGYAAFLVLYGLLARRFWAIVVSLVVVANYISMLAGFLPRPGISWDGHLAGAAAGVLLALFWTRRVRQQRRALQRSSYPPASNDPGTAFR